MPMNEYVNVQCWNAELEHLKSTRSMYGSVFQIFHDPQLTHGKESLKVAGNEANVFL